ncbi:helix-turn-helix domain-containing protein [Denitrobaculum tricleocarpae]|uniref:Helix-turn-helix transcriptional regulator n=1 Tax=Denitrobaculum tricleocarpae TaxID=2591009 RepID=A0A545TTP0_9PROT|nr:helix-turn-helix transcriptional regulator [Denitrobaculum tricleocarpae]TQV80573.1 helix-turn-helix transcriptional regulator [Denitrobaculum tricleocarpae]
MNRYVGRHLMLHRERMGLTQDKLARKLDLSIVDIQNAELGLNRLPAVTLYEACEIFEISLRSFFGGFIEAQSEVPNRQTPNALPQQPSNRSV